MSISIGLIGLEAHRINVSARLTYDGPRNVSFVGLSDVQAPRCKCNSKQIEAYQSRLAKLTAGFVRIEVGS